MEGHCTSEKPPFLRRQARAPTCQPCPSLREVACACSALARHCARSLWGRGPARALPTRARAAPSWRHSVHALWKGTARARGRRSFGARPVLPRASPAPHCARWLARVARLRATALALSGDEAQHVRFRRARAPRQAGDTRSMHYGRALHEREAAVPSAPGPCSHVPALPSHCARWLARVARLRATALALSGDEAQHVRFRRARAPRQAGDTRLMHYGRALHEREAAVPSAPGPCSHVPALPSLREVACACSALARHCARSLWGRGPARALPTRARAAPSWRHSVHALWKGTARARSRRSFGARPVLPRASPAPHCARWLARVARLRATALALSGDEAQHVRFRRARAPRQAGDTRSTHYGRALHEREAAVPSAPGPCSHVPALPLTARGGLRV